MRPVGVEQCARLLARAGQDDFPVERVQGEQLGHVLRYFTCRVINAQLDAFIMRALDQVAERRERVVAVRIVYIGRIETSVVDVEHIGPMPSVGLGQGLVNRLPSRTPNVSKPHRPLLLGIEGAERREVEFENEIKHLAPFERTRATVSPGKHAMIPSGV